MKHTQAELKEKVKTHVDKTKKVDATKMAKLLLAKGIITNEEYKNL